MRLLTAQFPKKPKEERVTWLADEGVRVEREVAKACVKQVEQLLTPKQLSEYKVRVFPLRANSILRDAGTRKLLGFSHEQEERFIRIENEWTRLTADQERDCRKKIVGLLDPQQRERLTAHGRIETLGDFSGNIEALRRPPDIDLPPGQYKELGKPVVRAS